MGELLAFHQHLGFRRSQPAQTVAPLAGGYVLARACPKSEQWLHLDQALP
jgi:hypothetical protein